MQKAAGVYAKRSLEASKGTPSPQRDYRNPFNPQTMVTSGEHVEPHMSTKKELEEHDFLTSPTLPLQCALTGIFIRLQGHQGEVPDYGMSIRAPRGSRVEEERI
uniref:Uncharacterized protein n=1 Tax=Steinernema glaseri TaxID=37863 RepID=A0A1I7Z1C9_9BILA